MWSIQTQIGAQPYALVAKYKELDEEDLFNHLRVERYLVNKRLSPSNTLHISGTKYEIRHIHRRKESTLFFYELFNSNYTPEQEQCLAVDELTVYTEAVNLMMQARLIQFNEHCMKLVEGRTRFVVRYFDHHKEACLSCL